MFDKKKLSAGLQVNMRILEEKIKNQFDCVEMEIDERIRSFKATLDDIGEKLKKKLNDSKDKVKK
jgi:hypothetical protein